MYERVLATPWLERAEGQDAKFIELWEDADPEPQPEVQAVRRRLARLVAAEGR